MTTGIEHCQVNHRIAWSKSIAMHSSQPGVGPFVFYTERRLVELTGLKAKNLRELLLHLRSVPGSAIFYHTHHQFLSHHFVKPEFRSDFAIWVHDALQEEALGERLAAIDLLEFTTIRELREALLATIEGHLSAHGGDLRQAPPGQEFHFCKSKSFVMPTGIIAYTVDELFEQVRHITNISLFFHFLEARLRLGRPTNDFSHWLSAMGERPLAEAIDRLNPYVVSLDELREQIVAIRQKHRA